MRFRVYIIFSLTFFIAVGAGFLTLLHTKGSGVVLNLEPQAAQFQAVENTARINSGAVLLQERERWASRIDEVGTRQAYEEFKAEYAPLRFDAQHLGAHIVGELLYEKNGIEGLSICDASFAFGCFHSFFGIALSDLGGEVISQLDKICVEKYGPLGTGCQHGIGHGILEYMGRDKLVAGLNACAKTTQLKDFFGCSSGVFMEYNTPIIVKNETAVAKIRELNPDNPIEPCNTIVPDRFRKSCYYELGQWWSAIFRNDYENMGKLCAAVETQEHKESCFLGLGNVAAPSSGYDVAETIRKCKTMPDANAELFCRAGASWSFFASPEQRSKAPAPCEGLGPEKEHYCIDAADLIGNGEIKAL